MGQILTTLYNIAKPHLPLSQKIINQIDFFKMHCLSAKLQFSLVKMRSSAGLQKRNLKHLHEHLLGYSSMEKDPLISLKVDSRFLKEGIEQTLECYRDLVFELENQKNFLLEPISDQMIHTLKSDIQNFLPEMEAQIYIYLVLATQSLDPKCVDWKEELEEIFASEDCAQDLKQNRREYEQMLASFKEANKNDPELVASVTELIDYLDSTLPRPQTPTLKYTE